MRMNNGLFRAYPVTIDTKYLVMELRLMKWSYLTSKKYWVWNFYIALVFTHCPEKKKTTIELVYYTTAGGLDYEPALTSMGVSDEQLVHNLSKRIAEDVKTTGSIAWPPQVEKLVEAEELSPLLLQLISFLWRKSTSDLSPKPLALTLFVMQHILGKPTKNINATIALHVITKSKALYKRTQN